MRKTVAVGSAEAVPEAEQARAVLFVDEADSLFGKRTNATDAHDRYANVESTTSCSGLRPLREERMTSRVVVPEASRSCRPWQCHYRAVK